MIDTAQPQVKSIENSTSYGKFEIEPLEPGFGTTLGNALRRVLLSTLKGAAVTSVSIEGVAHEFSSIPYVKEDVTEIILNLKGLNLISYSDDPVRLTLDVTGPREVKASDIQAPSDVEIVNPELYICTLDSNKGRLRMELTVERGKGYVPAERNKKEGQPIGVIPIDAIFSPVVKANFLIEKTRVGQETDWDKLILEVWTDGTIQPDQAISEAAKQFTSHLGLFTRFTERIKDADVPPQTANRRAMSRKLVTARRAPGRIETTEAKGKELGRWLDRVIPTAKSDNVAARRAVDAVVEDPEVTERLFTRLLPRMKERTGGYTRVLKIGPRQGDGAFMVLVELVDR